jgi:hypothetical protein
LSENYPELEPKTTSGGTATRSNEGGWRLSIPPGEGRHYRLAQLDDYTGLTRRNFPWIPPLTLHLEARVSARDAPGTWGFGFWNDPFALSLGFGGGTRRLPALPKAAWFFYASPPNFLSFQEQAPGQGFLAQTFQTPTWPAPLLALGALGAPLLFWPWMARKLRPLLNKLIKGASRSLAVQAASWHAYTLTWNANLVTFQVDGEQVYQTNNAPDGPLGLVLWIDNQFAAYPPDGRLAYGTLPVSETAWIEIRSLSIETGANNI